MSDVRAFQQFSDRLDETIAQADALAIKRKLGAVGWFSALRSFQDSFGFDGWTEQVPRLIRAMEGALLPEGAREAVKHRLRQRLCLLLQVDSESSDLLFDDIGHLYDMRSEVEHAADVKAAKLLGRIRSVAGAAGERSDGVDEWRAIGSLRDLVRRSIVTRIVLATGDSPMWPIDDTKAIDRRLLEDGFRARCREQLAAADAELGLRLSLGSRTA
ncbi:hypothetical protein [Candidatus Poriferisocius sp.]|uniref:hypothetical protein n=1 Tax=Candidatus Poriferisocius sp. TaxID=3101276 RepID=UPI003B59CE09